MRNLDDLRETVPADFKWEINAFMPDSGTVFDYVLLKTDETYWQEWNCPQMLSMSSNLDVIIIIMRVCNILYYNV